MVTTSFSRYIASSLLFTLGLAAAAHEGGHGPLPQPPRLAQATPAAPETEGTPNCALTIRLTGADAAEAVPGVVHLTDQAGQTIRPAELLPRTTGLSVRSTGEAAHAYMDRWYLLPGERTVTVPSGPVAVSAFSGLNTRLATRSIDLSGKAVAELTLPVVPIDARAEPWIAGNVHLHLQKMSLAEAERYATEVAQGDGLDVVFFSYLERAEADVHYISNTFTEADLNRFSARSGVLFGYGEEYRHNFPGEPGYGHVMFLDLPELIRPASFGPDIMKQGHDDGTLRPGIEKARAQNATVLWCHNAFGHEDIPSWVAGLLDGQIIFDGGAQGDYESGFYRYLNIGLHVPISMGTDWFYNDMAMTIVPVDGALTTASWLAALRAGQSYITNGPLLEFTVNGRQPGTRLALEDPGTVEVHARAVGRNDFLGLELVANGEVIRRVTTRTEAGVFTASLDASIPVSASTWLAVRATPFTAAYDRPESVTVSFNEYGKPLFAHTSPIYVDLDGKPVFVPAAAESLLEELRASMDRIRDIGSYTSDAARDDVIAVYEAAAETLEDALGR